MKKTIAIILAVLMIAAAGATSFAADGDFSTTPDAEIKAKSVEDGDHVYYFQLVEWDATNSNWKLTTLGNSCGVSLENLIDGITETEASTIAGIITGTGTDMGASGTTRTATVAPGLYYLRAVPSTADFIYNPAFVSADYYEGGNEVDFSESYDSSTILKKSPLPLTKEVTGSDNYTDVKPGDEVPFKVTTTIPTYGSSYDNESLTFKVEDTLEPVSLLKLKDNSISVKYGSATVTASNSDVTISPKADKSGYTVEFTNTYLRGLDGATPGIEITYTAVVQDASSGNVTPMKNTAKLTFSNTPSSTSSKEAKTRHYIFEIDGSLLGGAGDKSSELIKTATDKNGNILTENNETYHSTTVSVLENASFTLTGKAGTPTAGISQTVDSDDKGRIHFTGLDAGEYTLTETSAPAGFIRDTRTFTVTITPTYDATQTDLLTGYSVSITAPASGSTPAFSSSSSFTITNDGETVVSSSEESATAFINNTQGKELPTTGGIGTTIFYVVGSLMVVAAVVILVTKKRVQD